MTLLNKAKRPPADTTRRRPLRAILATLLLAPLLMLATTATPAAAQETVTCYLLSDGTDNELSADALYRVDDVFGTPSVVSVGATGTNNAEAFAIRPGFGGYAWDDTDGLVTVDLTDGTTADAAFDIAGVKVEGLTWANVDNADSSDDILYVVRSDGAVEGFDPAGAAAGISADIAAGAFTEGTDIAWDAAADQLFAVRANGDASQVVTVSPAVAALDPGTSADDLEGLGFAPAGQLIGTTGGDAGQANNLFSINKTTGAEGASLVNIAAAFDSEDVDCISPDLPGGTITASATGTCVGVNAGQISVTVTHTSGDPVAYTIAVGATTIGNGTVSTDAPNATALSAANLADGDYVITVTADGEAISVADSPVTIDCAPPDSTISATAAFVECTNGAGDIEVDVTFVSGDDPATYTIGWQNAQQDSSISGTIAAGTVTRMINGIVEGSTTITVTNTTGGASFQVLSEVVTFDCPPPELSAVAAFDLCEDDAGTVEIIVTYVSGSEQASYEISWTNDVQTGTLPGTLSSGSVARTINGLVDGTTTITVTNTSVNPPEVVSTTPITFACDQPELTATAAVAECVDDMAVITVDITNTSTDTAASYELEWTNPNVTSSLVGSIAANTTETLTTPPLADSDTVVTVLNTTGDGRTIVLEATLTIDCVPPVPGEISGAAASSCVDMSGTITVTVTHSAGETPVTYRVEVTNQNNTTGAIASTDDPVDVEYAGLADGTYAVSVFNTSEDPDLLVLEQDVLIVCAGNAPDALAQVVCSADSTGGTIEFQLTNPTDTATDFTLAVEGQPDVQVTDVLPNSLQVETVATMLADGNYAVSATADSPFGEVYAATVNVACSPPLVASFAVDCATDPGAGVDRVITLTVDGSDVETMVDFEITFNGTTTDAMVNAGGTYVDVLETVEPGQYPLTVTTAAGIVLINEIVEITEPCLTATPAAFCSVFNPSEGKIRVEFNNTSDQPLMGTVGVQASDGVLRTTPPNGGTTFTIPANFLTNVTLTRVVPDGEYEVYVYTNGQIVAAEFVTLTCENPVEISDAAAEIGAAECPAETIPITLTTSNGNTSVLFVVTLDGGTVTLPGITPPTVTVNANSQQTINIGPLPDNLDPGYSIVVSVDDVPIASESVMVGCDIPGIPKANVTAPVCGANDGMPALGGFFDVTLLVEGGTRSEDFIVSINGNPFETVVVNGSSSTTIPFGPFPDGQFTVSATVDGVEVMGSPEIVNIDCRTVTAIAACDADNVGSIILSYVNDSPSSVTFTGTVAGLDPESVNTTVAPGNSTTDERGPLEDDTYTVTIAEDGVVVFSEAIEVDCVIEGVPSAAIGDVECVTGGTIEVILAVAGGTVAEDFTISVDGVVAPNQPITISGDSLATTSVGPFADGVYEIAVEVNGVTILTEAVSVQCAEVAIAVECVDGAGRLVFTYTNNTDSQAIFETSTTGQVTDNAGASVAPGGTATVATSTPLPDGTYVVRTTSNAVEIDTSTVDVDCEAGILITDECLAGNGVIRVSVNNSTGADATVQVVITSAANGAVSTQTQVVEAGETEVISRSGRPDGTYTVEVSLDGALALTQTALVDCNGEPPPPPPIPVMHAVSCLAGNGRVDTNIVNPGPDAATYRLEFQGLSPRQTDVAAGDWWRMPVTGRPDGQYTVVVKRDGVTVSTQTLTVSCDTNPPVADDDEVRVVNACRAGNGYLIFQFVNNTAAAKSYVIEFQGVANRSTTAAAYGQAVRAVTGRPDGTYAVTIRSAGVVVESLSVTVDCDA